MKKLLLVSLAVCAMTSTGCLSRGIKEGIGAVRGGKGSYSELVSPTRDLRSFDSIAVGTFTSDYAQIPAGMTSLIRPRLETELTSKGQPVGASGSKTLEIRGRIMYYETASLMGQAFGPLEEAVAIVELVDRSSGQMIGKAACVGRTTSSTSMGAGTKAEGLSRAIAEWIDKYRPMPKPE